MIRTLTLLLPALIPSWRFFAAVEKSPRIQYSLLPQDDSRQQNWINVRELPQKIPPSGMLRRLFWNPYRNETLFLVSSAERFLDSGSKTHLHRILACIRTDLTRQGHIRTGSQQIQLRILLLTRDGNDIHSEEIFRSSPYPLQPDIAP